MNRGWSLVALVVLGVACSATRAAAPPTPPAGASTTTAPPSSEPATATTDPSAHGPDPSSTVPRPTSTTAGTTVGTTTTTTTTATSTTTTVPALAGWAAFDAYLDSHLIGSGDHAASVAVAIQGELVHTAAFGVRDVGTREPADIVDRFRIASISKVITAAVVLTLVEDGTLGLDQPVGSMLAEQSGVVINEPAIASITVRQLLSHTSGLPVYWSTFFAAGAASCPDAARIGLGGRLTGAPGSVYVYSNMNFCLLGLLIEAVTGQPYEQAVYQRLLTPLGITGMRLAGTFDTGPDEIAHLSWPGRNYMETLGAAGSWIASPTDLVRIADALDHSKPGWHPLSRAMEATMRRPSPQRVEYEAVNVWYGLGVFGYVSGAWGHTGTIENTHAMLLHRADGVTWAITVHGEYPSTTGDLEEIMSVAFDAGGFVTG